MWKPKDVTPDIICKEAYIYIMFNRNGKYGMQSVHKGRIEKWCYGRGIEKCYFVCDDLNDECNKRSYVVNEKEGVATNFNVWLTTEDTPKANKIFYDKIQENIDSLYSKIEQLKEKQSYYCV